MTGFWFQDGDIINSVNTILQPPRETNGGSGIVWPFFHSTVWQIQFQMTSTVYRAVSFTVRSSRKPIGCRLLRTDRNRLPIHQQTSPLGRPLRSEPHSPTAPLRPTASNSYRTPVHSPLPCSSSLPAILTILPL